ncbi:hypothetical protein ACFY2W_07870 [Streptomyces sp. NPDC001262]|uniref:hypothetical protein n=1 Tax=Streptomyces sp. NPDC001262 TaxID=3364552 RepID=UPI003684A943
MRSLPPPNLSARTVYRTCISKAIPRYKRRLDALEQAVVDAADEFEAAASAAALHTLKDLAKKPVDEADRTQLTNTYINRLVPDRAAGNALYNALKKVRHKICPLCGHRDVSTLDHQLPKMKYPLLAVVPINLVPACGICNKLKGEHVPKSASEQTLHPYYDDLADQQWLFSRLKWIESCPPEITYFIRPPEGADSVLAARVVRHFQMFCLAELYGPNAVREMSNIRGILRGMNAAGRHKFLLLAESSVLVDKDAGGQNHWKRALFQTLAGDSRYLEGGFDQF